MAGVPLLPSYLQTTNYYQTLEPSFDIELLFRELDQTGTQNQGTGTNGLIDPPNHFISTNLSGATASDKTARKREIDRKYRARIKQEKMQMKNNMDKLIIQNESLKQENVSQATRINQLTSDVDKLHLKCYQQNALIQSLSEQLVSRDVQLENQRLKFENAQLRHNPSRLGEDIKDLENFKMLRRLELRGCHNLKQIPDISPKSTLQSGWNEEQEEEEED